MSKSAERLNRYTCTECGGSIITIDREEGVTPFFLRCRTSTPCVGQMESAVYRNVTGRPTFEWRKPTASEYAELDEATRTQHVDRGGLLIYPIEEK